MTPDSLRRDVAYWQRLLRSAGYDPGPIDGISGPRTLAAANRWDADATFYAAQYGEFDERSESNMATICPHAQRAARQWLKLATARLEGSEYSVKIICGTRTYSEQDRLYAQGRTTSGPRVTNARAGYSWHNFGLAFDFGVFSASGKKYYGEHPLYRVLGTLALKVPGLTWGGNWTSFRDEPHLQLDKYASTAEARREFNR